MTRYTRKALESDVARMNETLELCRSDLRMLVGGRYGYTAIDLFRPGVYRDCGGIQRTLETGSPRECLAAAKLFVSQEQVSGLIGGAK